MENTGFNGSRITELPQEHNQAPYPSQPDAQFGFTQTPQDMTFTPFKPGHSPIFQLTQS